MSSRWRVSLQAANELAGIWLYVAQDNPAAADRQMDNLYDKFPLIAAQPGIGRRRDDLAPDMRSVVAGSYVIVYRIKSDMVEIAHIFHGARDIPRLL